MTTHAVPQIILQQLGGNRFCQMTGAKNLVGGKDMLMFALPAKFAANGINRVRIMLATNDTYKVEFMKVRNSAKSYSVKVIEEIEGVYADNLRRTFTSATGLDTGL